MQRFTLVPEPVIYDDLAIAAVQEAAAEQMADLLNGPDGGHAIVLAALSGEQLWLACAASGAWYDDEHLQQIADLDAEAVPLVLAGGDHVVMVSADREGRCGVSSASRPRPGKAPVWFCPPAISAEGYEALLPLREALGVADEALGMAAR